VQFEFMQRFRSRLAAEAVEFLTMDADDVARIAVPAKNRAEDVVEFGKFSWSETEIRRITIGLT
jgi:hypothetical protein